MNYFFPKLELMSVVPTLSLGPPHSIENRLSEQQEVIQSLFDAFKLLTEESVKKDRRIEKIESINAQLRELISLHLVDGLDLVKRKVDRLDRVDSIEKDLNSVKIAVEDIKFSSFLPSGRSPSPNRTRAPPLPFMSGAEASSSPSIGLKQSSWNGLDKLTQAVENVLTGIDFMSRQRNSDVESINVSLEKLDARIKLLASSIGEDANFVEKQSVIGYVSSHKNFNALMTEIRALKEEIVPDIESEWAERHATLASKLDSLSEEVRKNRSDLSSYNEKLTARDARLSQLMSSGETGKRLLDRTEQLAGDVTSRVIKLEVDFQSFSEDLKRVADAVDSVTNLESKLDLSKAECRSNWERTSRQAKHDVDSLRVKLERIAIVRDEYDRLSSEMKSLHELVLSHSTGKRNDFRHPISASPPPLYQQVVHQSNSPSFDSSSSLSVLDEGIFSASSGITARLSAIPSILVPTGGAESGTLRVDPSTSRILWRVDNMASVIREPARYPKIFLSPEFTASKDGKSNALVARMKLFPHGSDQSRIDGNCSFYLRCLPGVIVRYAVDIGGEVMDTFECEYEKQRDKGKHDFVKLNEFIEPDGSVVIGIELRSIAPMKAQ